MNEPFIVKDGYDRNKHKVEYKVRYMTLDEVKALGWGKHHFIGNDGTLRHCRLNGQIKRWKRDPDRIEVPLKYGLKECVRWDGREACQRLVFILERINPLLGERWA